MNQLLPQILPTPVAPTQPHAGMENLPPGRCAQPNTYKLHPGRANLTPELRLATPVPPPVVVASSGRCFPLFPIAALPSDGKIPHCSSQGWGGSRSHAGFGNPLFGKPLGNVSTGAALFPAGIDVHPRCLLDKRFLFLIQSSACNQDCFISLSINSLCCISL